MVGSFLAKHERLVWRGSDTMGCFSTISCPPINYVLKTKVRSVDYFQVTRSSDLGVLGGGRLRAKHETIYKSSGSVCSTISGWPTCKLEVLVLTYNWLKFEFDIEFIIYNSASCKLEPLPPT